jgi:GH25 family lysozyme M1 (1,4-beta-N-acetylmuramidase)
MTIFGPDLSSFQHGVNVSALSDPFVMMKCTEGTYYVDADYPTWLSQARSAGKLAVAYHFISGEDFGAQAAHLEQHIIDKQVPVMIDWEPEGSFKPTLGQLYSLIDAINARGMRVRLAYVPRWFWASQGSGDLSPLRLRGVGVVSSAYTGRAGETPVIGYRDAGGDTGAGWEPYGGITPVLWQYTDSGLEQQSLDFNAFRGTIDQLAALLGGSAVGGDVNLTDTVTVSPGFAARYPLAANPTDGFTAGAQISVGTLLEGAALRAVNNEHLLEDVSSKLDVLLKRPAVDVGALANQIVAAIEQHLSTNADAQAVAVAVQAQLAAALGGHGVG